MDRSRSASSSRGGVRLNYTYCSGTPSIAPPPQQWSRTPSPYGAPTGYSGFPLHGIPSRPPSPEHPTAASNAPGQQDSNARGRPPTRQNTPAVDHTQMQHNTRAPGQSQTQQSMPATSGRSQMQPNVPAFRPAQMHQNLTPASQAQMQREMYAASQNQMRQRMTFGRTLTQPHPTNFRRPQPQQSTTAFGRPSSQQSTAAFGPARIQHKMATAGQTHTQQNMSAFARAPQQQNMTAAGQNQTQRNMSAFGRAPQQQTPAALGHAPAQQYPTSAGRAPTQQNTIVLGRSPLQQSNTASGSTHVPQHRTAFGHGLPQQNSAIFGRTPLQQGPGNFERPTTQYRPAAFSHALTRAREPVDLARFIRTGATESPESQSEAYRRPRRNTNGASKDIAPQYYEPPRRMTGTSSEMSMMPTENLSPGSFNTVNKAANTKGNSAAFTSVDVVDPQWCYALVDGFLPTVAEMFEALPFIEPCRIAAPSNAAVLCVGNIPYGSPRSQVAAFVARNVPILNQPASSPFYAVHIVMERHTGKTMDAYIEFNKAADAYHVLHEFDKRKTLGRHPKIGDRDVQVQVSTQEHLMVELFPRARNAYFKDGSPHVVKTMVEYFPSSPAAGFTGFLQSEEIVHMVKHAEFPNRSPFAQRSFIRTYESMISTLHKYPWFAHEQVLLTQRLELFKAASACTRALVSFLQRYEQDRVIDESKPTRATLQELVAAILTCPGFSEKEKHGVIVHLHENGFGDMANGRKVGMHFGGNSWIAGHWPFLVLARNPLYSDEYVEWVADQLKLATTLDKNTRTSGTHRGPFGNIQIDYGNAKTIEEAGTIELQYVERLFGIVLPAPIPNTAFRPPPALAAYWA